MEVIDKSAALYRPCPFCPPGQAGELRIYADAQGYAHIECKNCLTPFNGVRPQTHAPFPSHLLTMIPDRPRPSYSIGYQKREE